MSEETLRALIRHIPAATTLRSDLERSLQLQNYDGLGDTAIKTYLGLHASVLRLSDDPYLEALSIDVNADATDKEKISIVMLAIGQLLAFLQSQTGLYFPGSGGGSHNVMAPSISLAIDGSADTDKIMDMVNRVLGNDAD